MSGWTILAAVAAPPLILAVLLVTPLRRLVPALTVVAPAPALVAAIWAPGRASATVEPLVLGLSLGFDDVAGVLLVQVAAMWSLAGLHLVRGRPFGRRFPVLCLLLTMVGSLGTVVALDMVSFYVFLSIMTVASYGLVETGRHDPEERRAARIYLGLALLGEFLALVAFLLMAAGMDGAEYVWLLYFGLGSKLGVLPLHVALPLVYRAAPPVGAAVMGGVLLTSTAVGWLRFLPDAGAALETAVPALLTAGLAAAFLGALLGLLQREARAALGYSTVSQMGLLTAFTAVAAAEPHTWSAVLPVLALFLVHHGFCKGGLLLAMDRAGAAVGAVRRAVLVVLSLALAAAPATGGAVAKLWIKEEEHRLPGVWHDVAAQLLPFTSVATALLMARIVWLAIHAAPRRSQDGRSGPLPAALAAVGAMVLPWQIVMGVHHEPLHLVFSRSHLWATTWPVLLGLALFLMVAVAERAGRRLPPVPAGDILEPSVRLWRAVEPARAMRAGVAGMARARRIISRRTRRGVVITFQRLRYAERGFRDLRIMGTAFAGLVIMLSLMIVFWR
ncbi:proton-conducting transporter membrane subunit [Caenispirillum salinarum]|uniref:proton-conducting transporter transmembrane domain-containing protein n=1 Tax=Caenispirillum salinarum TaxID=859058 RepID=UPI003850C844